MRTKRVVVERPADGVASVVLDRPDRLNALDQDGFDDLTEAFATVGADPSVRAVVVTGTGRAFCAGADISGAGGLADEDAARRWMERTHRGPLALHHLPQPTIAAVVGPAAGAGLGLALLCDIRLGDPTASFSAPFGRMGLVPDFGVSTTLPAVVGSSLATEALLTGRKIGAEEAVAAGILSRITDDVRAEAETIAARIAALPGDTAAVTKRHLRDCAAHPVDHVLRRLEPDAQARALAHPEFAARARAWFAAKGGAKR
ncbi:enoyl-CoA hydratase/isomerase family protein [Patulibacter minatonensis]|uniref:enoyl-CoA hydratase/isomerase family protein n=1 Tax=Patulibacter minatonensis TaxID=298163 RepID=UPI0012FA3B82|nr:enoyl-CoA hydratase/isomerase family protein [Patulibacter minatonensis]